MDELKDPMELWRHAWIGTAIEEVQQVTESTAKDSQVSSPGRVVAWRNVRISGIRCRELLKQSCLRTSRHHQSIQTVLRTVGSTTDATQTVFAEDSNHSS